MKGFFILLLFSIVLIILPHLDNFLASVYILSQYNTIDIIDIMAMKIKLNSTSL